ncbi:MAG: DUF3800 domain-containing protein [Planctomycetes bacterium]|nr:DUF3800 domain-containing protein [Planctomycetota bacterium]
MKFDIYCDESRPDLLSSKNATSKFMVIGSLWLKTANRSAYKEGIHDLRNKHLIGGEFKWQKASPSKLPFYLELIDWFYKQGDNLRFRCIAVEHQKVNLLHYHDNDQELGFYKFYYQLLHHWILDFNEYAVFCDFKSNRRRDRLHVLKRCLEFSNLSSSIKNVQAVRSKESVLTQLTDVLTGVAAARLNETIFDDSAKGKIACLLEENLNKKIGHTWKNEQKFNVFVIDLQGGW